MAAWFSLAFEEEIRREQLLQDSLNRYDHSSLTVSTNPTQKYIRLTANSILTALPYSIYRPLTTVLKKLRSGNHINAFPRFTPAGAHRVFCDARDEYTTPAREDYFVCLTHDVDTKTCSDLWEGIVELEESAGVRSTWNVLTEGPYRINGRWLDQLEKNGFEIGLHGDTHDMAIGFRTPEAIRRRLIKCMDILERPIGGYRAPALAVSEDLLHLLSELGFRYDSSIKVRCVYKEGIDNALPYRYPDTGLWELPLVVQDDVLFRDLHLNNDEALELLFAVAGIFKRYGGLMVINTHPVNLADHRDFYTKLLEFLTHNDSIRIMTAGELVNQLDAHVNRIKTNDAAGQKQNGKAQII